MKIRVVSSKDEIDSLSKSEKILHLTFRPSNKDIFDLIQKCPEVKAIHMPGSYLKTISDSTKMLLDMQGVSLLEGDIWGHRKDINEYYEIKQEAFDTIEELKKEGLSEAEILKRMKRTFRLSEDLLQFLMKEKKKK
jgi:hypothetical protein